VTRADLTKEPHEVATMFDGVAERYDRTNSVLSFGRDRRWRRQTRLALAPGPQELVLDLAAGTGVSTAELGRSGAFVVGADLSVGMLRVGRRSRPEVPLLAGDALALPFADGALREMARVTRPGGRLVVCEFSHPTWRPFRGAYLGYLMRALPRVARSVSSNPDAYVYLAESIRAWPDQAGLARRIAAAGWHQVAWRDLTGGVVALHRAVRA
jgi:demethylmenaquinone methyltransferase/2-methoxy-6-polyprenyl-1,4-benzoquinol methylase